MHNKSCPVEHVEGHVEQVEVCRRLSLSNSLVPTVFDFFIFRACTPRAQNTKL